MDAFKNIFWSEASTFQRAPFRVARIFLPQPKATSKFELATICLIEGILVALER